MPEKLKGRSYLAFLLDLVIPSPALLDALTARLYPVAAARFATTASAVERCIRHAIEATWSRGDMAALERLFGLSIDPDRGKPTNREFLAMSAQHLRLAEAMNPHPAEGHAIPNPSEAGMGGVKETGETGRAGGSEQRRQLGQPG